VGVFQFESAGMQDSLRKLRPDCLEDLIALGALYRPGPMDNIPTYIACKHGKQKPDYLHPMLEEVLKETYGVIIYQEQVQKIAQVMSGYTLGAADLLRRAMGKKIKAEMDAQREQFVAGARARGVEDKQSSGIFDLVAKFAGYGFNKSHAAAYAVIAYQTAYLKANYPVEFIAASMTYDMHATDKLNVFRQEAEKARSRILPPDINRSDVLFSVELSGEALCIRYALAAIKNVGEQAMRVIVEERKANGPFKDIFDLANRVDANAVNRRQFEHLVMAGAFDSLNQNRKQLFDSLDLILGMNSKATRDRESNQSSLFGAIEDSMAANVALKPMEDWPALERLNHEFSAVGFYLSAHPLEAYAGVLKQAGITQIAMLEKRLGDQYSSIKLAGI
ncbi:MAG: DNA polymerase III subunit alpha, partial [Alphaproteobacteria bacterium]|nr:DNA polymerase III subunit alpha [Alphaproteobacteria bacterium]